MNKPIEEVAEWPWRRKYAYAIAYGAIQEDVDGMDMPDTNVGSGNTPNMPNVPNKTPSDGPRKGTHPSVAKHDNVFHVQNGN